MNIEFRRATRADVPVLAEMNQQLIIDESSRNPMNKKQLTERLEQWLDDGRTAVLLLREGEIIGYMLYYRTQDEYHPYQDSVYIRQYFIKRNFRRRGIGQIAFEAIVREYFPPNTVITLDVLESNPEAKAFWYKQGFDIYSTTMRRDTNL